MFIKLKYKAFEFPENPAEISIDKSKNISARSLPGSGSAVEEVSRGAAVIRISGGFYGADRELSASRLCALHDEYGAGPLYLPGGEFFYAFFSALKLIRNAAECRIDYELVFTEDERYKKARAKRDCTVAAGGENAFDIAARCGCTVEHIVEKNSLKTPFDIIEGQRLKI